MRNNINSLYGAHGRVSIDGFGSDWFSIFYFLNFNILPFFHTLNSCDFLMNDSVNFERLIMEMKKLMRHMSLKDSLQLMINVCHYR